MMQLVKSARLANKTKLEFLKIKYYKCINYFKTYTSNKNNYKFFS